MPDIKPVRVDNIQGGLFSGEPTLADDNQLQKAQNVFYNKDGLLQSRRGQANYGNPIPDAIILINACEAPGANGTFSASSDAVNVGTGTAKQGSGSVDFDVDVSNSGDDFATITNNNFSAVDITNYKGDFRFFFFTPTGGTTDLTDLNVRLGSDASNYYEWTVTPATLNENDWKLLVLDFTSATVTGSPVDTGIDYWRLQLNYANTYTDKTGFAFDHAYCAADTANKPMMSLKYFKSTDTSETRYLLANVGTALYEFDEDSGEWFPVKTGLTEGARFGFTAYKNIMYFTNGVDNYFSYTGTVTAEHTGANTYKGKFVLLANDIGYIAGDPSVPTTLAYTGGSPTNLQTFTNTLVVDEDDSAGRITGLTNLGPIVIVTKEKKIYEVNVATPSRQQLDYSDGARGNRAIVRVENSVYFLNERGVYTLAQRQAVEGDLRADPITDSIQQLVDTFSNEENAAAYYSQDLRNYYLFTDANDDAVNDTCLVGAIIEETSQGGLKRSFTNYTGVNANEAVVYEDSDGELHLLIANALSGQMREIEVGTDDNGTAIVYDVITKTHDFGLPETEKTFEYVDLFGFINEMGAFDLEIYIDGVLAQSGTVDGDNFVVAGSGRVYYLGGSALATSPLGGAEGASGTTLYPFKVRLPLYQTGFNIYLRIFSNNDDTQFILTKYNVYPFAQPFGFFPEVNLI